MFVREVKCKSALSGPDDWILRYIRTCLFYVSEVPAESIRLCLQSFVLYQSLEYGRKPTFGVTY